MFHVTSNLHAMPTKKEFLQFVFELCIIGRYEITLPLVALLAVSCRVVSSSSSPSASVPSGCRAQCWVVNSRSQSPRGSGGRSPPIPFLREFTLLQDRSRPARKQQHRHGVHAPAFFSQSLLPTQKSRGLLKCKRDHVTSFPETCGECPFQS